MFKQAVRGAVVAGALVMGCASSLAAGSESPPGGDQEAAHPPLMSAPEIIQVLDQSVDWYRTLGVQQKVANEPSDMLFLYENRQTANKVIGLAFEMARANAELIGKAAPADQAAEEDPDESLQSLASLQGKLDQEGRAIQAELDARRKDLLAAASKKSRAELQAKINELQGELGLVDTKKEMLGTMRQFVGGTGDSSADALKARIDAMAAAIPSSTGAQPAATATPAPPASAGAPAPPALLAVNSAPTVARWGLWDLAAEAFRLSEKAATIAAVDRRTADLQAALARIRTPLIAHVKALSTRGDSLARQADSANSLTLNDFRQQLDALADRYKQASTLLIPLSREGVLLAQYRRNLTNWRDAVRTQYRSAVKTLALRVGIVLVVLALVFGGADLWRRMVLRYIQDTRRRYQLLLLRRIALWSLVVVVIGIAFASELGSIVTFAGLITAGIAVAMQSVLVSIVGYFFLIGKYGIRVGDRVQIGEVTGEVIDLGLVRMYLMELGAKGAMGPTGRVVAFANSVVFQVSGGLFKQIPGVNFSWREIILTLPGGVDYPVIKDKLLAAVTDALKDYRAEILRQTQEIKRTTLSSWAGDSQPQVQLRFSVTGVEAHVRYPVHLQHAAEIDERVTEALANVISEVAGDTAKAVTAALTSAHVS